MVKIVTVVGARPQFIKAAPVTRELVRAGMEEIMIHTGQHYDHLMSQVFFDSLAMPRPAYQLQIGSGSHGGQTGEMLARIEEVLLGTQPDWVLVYGDTNSTLAGALAAAKLHIPIAHVEAGLRSFNRRMPEEINRVLTDHVSRLFFVPSEIAVDNLRNEGLTHGVHLVGDVMYDAVTQHRLIAEQSSIVLQILGVQKRGYMLATVHRAENTDHRERIAAIAQAFRELCKTVPIVWPVHPRTRKVLEELGLKSVENLLLTEPAPYLDMLQLEASARVILTDSGGVQKEAQWFEVPCVTLRDETEWLETVESGWNQLVGADAASIIAAALTARRPSAAPAYKTEGASLRIARILSATKSQQDLEIAGAVQ